MLNDLQKETLRHAITRSGLEHRAEIIMAAARSAIRLRPTAVDSEVRSVSRLGGGAALPEDCVWPTWKGRPQALIAQVMLADVVAFDSERVLPASGRLLFFYDAEQETWGFDPNDRGSWKVAFVADDQPTGVFSDPGIYQPVPLTPSAEISLPPWESLWFESSGLTAAETDAYLDLRENFKGEELIHKMLGYPDPVQNAMEAECQFVSNGIYCGDANGYASPQAEALRSGASNGDCCCRSIPKKSARE